MKVCVSCGKQAKRYTEFEDPKCSEKIVRCKHCKEMAIEYRGKCGFRGP